MRGGELEMLDVIVRIISSTTSKTMEHGGESALSHNRTTRRNKIIGSLIKLKVHNMYFKEKLRL